ncbi:MFS transporter [Catelliglobosispora koreensis]|uniref:MFS transporter n=1 Tax=Catelliglobosispora koreensis TaxID=129052 RepID=UPI000362B320|nr:MFS transporter [Catelliglobosispora koreensis]
MSRIRENLIPPAGLPRKLAIQSLLFGIGRGAFTTGSAVYFLKMVHLKPWEIGVGLSVAAGVAMVSAVPIGALADRFRSRSVWYTGVFICALLFALYPAVRGFWLFTLLLIGLELAQSFATTGRNVYLVESLEPEIRVVTQAFNRSWLNVGWGLGTGAAGFALAVDKPWAYHAMVYVNVAVMLINVVMISRLPRSPLEHHPRVVHAKRVVFKDRPYLTVHSLVAVLLIHGTISLEVVPLWLVVHTDAPKWMLAVLTWVNTIMATTLQVAMTRGSHTIPGARRVLRYAAWVGALCCPIFYFSGLTSGWATIALLVLATILVTMAELWQSAAQWTLMAELAPHDRKGEYMGVARMFGSGQHMIAPAALIALAVTTGGWGWFAIALIFVAVGLAGGAAVDWAERTRPTVRANDPVPAVAA